MYRTDYLNTKNIVLFYNIYDKNQTKFGFYYVLGVSYFFMLFMTFYHYLW